MGLIKERALELIKNSAQVRDTTDIIKAREDDLANLNSNIKILYRFLGQVDAQRQSSKDYILDFLHQNNKIAVTIRDILNFLLKRGNIFKSESGYEVLKRVVDIKLMEKRDFSDAFQTIDFYEPLNGRKLIGYELKVKVKERCFLPETYNYNFKLLIRDGYRIGDNEEYTIENYNIKQVLNLKFVLEFDCDKRFFVDLCNWEEEELAVLAQIVEEKIEKKGQKKLPVELENVGE